MKQFQRSEQKQKMSTRQKQSLSILSMSAPELSDYLNEQYDSNPLLFREDVMLTGASYYDDGPQQDTMETMVADTEDILDDLFLQLHASHQPQKFMKVGDYLIASLDDRGYLDDGYEDAMDLFDIGPGELEDIIMWLQDTLEPVGVFARDLQECLLIQAVRLHGEDTELLELIESHFDELAAQDIAGLSRGMGLSSEAVQDLLSRLSELTPNPMNGLGAQVSVQYKIPEVEIIRDEDDISVKLLNDQTSVSVNPVYLDARNNGLLGRDERTRMQGYLNEARQLVFALEQRYRTLLRVANYLVMMQREHFLSGQPLSGLSESDVAESLDISVSTVSRTVKEKYFLYEGEVHSFSELLSPKLASGISRDEIHFLIQSLIAMEKKDAPLSDAFIAKYCCSNGHPVSRRVIAKYRQELNIPSSTERRKLLVKTAS